MNAYALVRSAVMLGDDEILRHVNESPRQVAGLGRSECGISESLSCAVSGDEVLQHVHTFAEVRSDWVVDGLTCGVSHESANARHLSHLTE